MGTIRPNPLYHTQSFQIDYRQFTIAKMSLKNDKFPASAAFDTINEALNATDADRKDAIKQGNGIYAFTLKNKSGETESWHIDLRRQARSATALAPSPMSHW